MSEYFSGIANLKQASNETLDNFHPDSLTLTRESHWRLVVAWGGLLVLRIARSRSRLLLLLLLLPCLLLL
jgi:hypothetical protein